MVWYGRVWFGLGDFRMANTIHKEEKQVSNDAAKSIEFQTEYYVQAKLTGTADLR